MMANLNRFVEAQASSYETALAELSAGRKHSHWMWFIFPQLAGLGSSPTARYYAIRDLREAAAYLEHPLLGERLITASRLLLGLPGSDARAIFGSPDDLKLRSSMTLFSRVDGADPVFQQVLDKLFKGMPDKKTLDLLSEN